jgi:hypothetical protein
MMKLTFEQVLEYLEAGKEDPEFEERIEMDPDGARLREEAELFLVLLRDRAEDEDDDRDHVAEMEESVAALRVESAEPMFDLSDADEALDTPRRINPKKIMHTADLAARIAGPVRDLGVLELSFAGPYIETAFYSDTAMLKARRDFDSFSTHMLFDTEKKAPPPRRRQAKFDKSLMSFMDAGSGGGERDIRGRGIQIRLPDSVDPSGPIRLEVRDTRINVPARGLEMVFMPEIGPYSRLVTNSKGIVDLPVPDQPGVLRIETTPPQMVRIELRNS